jgi:hypothetical protein
MILIKMLFVVWTVVALLLLSWVIQYFYDEYFKNK